MKVHTKYWGLLCEWNNRDRNQHYVVKWQNIILGLKSIVNEPLVQQQKNYLPIILIKLGIIVEVFKCEACVYLNFLKMKILKLLYREIKIERGLSTSECNNLVCNKKSENYTDLSS